MSMYKIIGYKQAAELLMQGHIVKECPQIRGGNIAYLYSPEGISCNLRIRSDSWCKLQMKCSLVGRETYSKRSRSCIYLWKWRDNDKEATE